MKNLKKSKAFSLFEIVVSIVVLGIIAVTFPLILQSVTKTAKTVTKEEMVLNEMSLMSLILQYYFDENNSVGENFYKDLNASGGDINLSINSFSPYTKYARVGKAQFNNNELRSGSSYDVSDIGVDTQKSEIQNDISTYNDIDDFNGIEENIIYNENNKLIMRVNVYYLNDIANNQLDYNSEEINFTYNYNYNKSINKTNIKLIKITGISKDVNITLYYPTCNIGASKFLSLEEISR
jgi:type II secretory pathway pseudopilin PulG